MSFANSKHQSFWQQVNLLARPLYQIMLPYLRCAHTGCPMTRGPPKLMRRGTHGVNAPTGC